MKYSNFFYIFCFCLLWGNSFGSPIGSPIFINENGENKPPEIPAILLVELSDPQAEKFRLDMEMFEKEQKGNPSPEPESTLGINNLFQRYLAFSKNVTLLLLSPFRIPQVLQPSFSFLPSLPKFPSLNIPNSVYPSFMFHPMFTTGGSEIPDIPVDVDTSKFVLPVPGKVESPKKPQANEHNFVQDPLPDKQNAKKPNRPPPAKPNKVDKVPVQVTPIQVQAQVTPFQPPKAPVPVEKEPILTSAAPINDQENAEKVPAQAPVPNKNQENVPVEQIQPAPAVYTPVQQMMFGKDQKVPTILIQHFNPVLIQHAPTPITNEDSKFVENVQVEVLKPAEPVPVALVAAVVAEPNKKGEKDQIVPVNVSAEKEISPEEKPKQVEADTAKVEKVEVEKSPVAVAVVDTETIPDANLNANPSIEQNEKTPIAAAAAAEVKPKPEPIKDESKTVEVENDIIDPFFSHPNPEDSVGGGETVSLYTSTAATVYKPEPIPIAETDPESFFDANEKVVEIEIKE